MLLRHRLLLPLQLQRQLLHYFPLLGTRHRPLRLRPHRQLRQRRMKRHPLRPSLGIRRRQLRLRIAAKLRRRKGELRTIDRVPLVQLLLRRHPLVSVVLLQCPPVLLPQRPRLHLAVVVLHQHQQRLQLHRRSSHFRLVHSHLRLLLRLRRLQRLLLRRHLPLDRSELLHRRRLLLLSSQPFTFGQSSGDSTAQVPAPSTNSRFHLDKLRQTPPPSRHLECTVVWRAKRRGNYWIRSPAEWI